MSLPIHRRAVHEISMTLAQLDADGATLTPGVTSIAQRPRRGDGATAPRVPGTPARSAGIRPGEIGADVSRCELTLSS